jgi:hypothetical protein
LQAGSHRTTIKEYGGSVIGIELTIWLSFDELAEEKHHRCF